jgi:DNA repair photolyase
MHETVATPPTRRPAYLEIRAKSLLNRVRGMPFEWSINPYRGCIHQCVFCYARRTHGFYELDGARDWGSSIFVKVNAVEVLRKELAAHREPNLRVAIGTATDPYQAAEGRYRLTRGILGELARAKTPAHLITRSPLVVRDIDVLQELSRAAGVSVCVSVPTLDERLAREAEPTVAPPLQRLRAITTLAQAGIRVGVAIAPVLPFLTDSYDALHDVYAAAAQAGASFAWQSVLNLGDVARDTYFEFLSAYHPDLAPRYRELFRGGKYIDRAYARDLEKRAELARASVAFEPPEIVATAAPLQLSMFTPQREASF